MRDSSFYDMSPSSLPLARLHPFSLLLLADFGCVFGGAINLSNLEERDEGRGRRSARFSKLFVIAVSPPPDFSIEKRILSIVGLLHQQGEEGEGAWEKGGGGVAD